MSLEEEKVELGRFSKNFLPIFFNIYGQQPPEGESGTYRMAVLDTVKVYLSVTQTEVCLFTEISLEGLASFNEPRLSNVNHAFS